MKRSPLIPALLVVFLMHPLPLILADPGNCMFNVPDWNQPADGYFDAFGVFIPYTDPYGQRILTYPNWCGPTSGANIMGYWEKNPVLYNGNQVGLRRNCRREKFLYR